MTTPQKVERAGSPVCSRKKVRTVIGRSNRRQMIHSSLFYDGDAHSGMITSEEDAYGNNFSESEGSPGRLPRVPRSQSALGGTIGGLNSTIHSGGDMSYGWAAETLSRTDTSQLQSQTKSDIISAFRSTNVTSVSKAMSPAPGASRERLTANTRAGKASQPPAPSKILKTLRENKSLVDAIPPVATVDPRYVNCPVESSNRLAPKMAEGLSQGVNNRSLTPSPLLADGVRKGFKGTFRSSTPGPSVSGGLRNFLTSTPGTVRMAQTVTSVDQVLGGVDSGPGPSLRLERKPKHDTRYLTEPPACAAGGTYLSSGQRFQFDDRGLGAGNRQREDRMKRLTVQELRIQRRGRSNDAAQERASALEVKEFERDVGSIKRKAEQQRSHIEAAKAENSANQPKFQRFTDMLMGPRY